VLCFDDENVRRILPGIHRRVITYGLGEGADYRATDLSFTGAVSTFRLHVRGEDRGTVTLNVPGRFNVLNSLATIAVARELDVDWERLKAGMALYSGVGRRLEVKGTAGGVTVVDDYGHHPTEIRETLAAARHVWKGRFLVVFQPHRYSRTQGLFSEFTTAFPDADTLIITDIYAASEKPIPGIHAAALCEAVREQGHPDVTYMRDFEEIAAHLARIARPGDTVITQGAGSVWKIGEALLKRLATG
jgi:UDP-N-acetylmuramate--alanine ligase